MMPKFKLIVFTVLMMSAKPFSVNAQDLTKPNGLLRFFQNHTDTTVILHYSQNWLTLPSYKIISKKQDTITRYIYEFSYNELPKMPSAFKDTLIKNKPELKYKEAYKEFYDIGINKFLKALPTQDKKIVSFWQSLNSLKPWELKDDGEFGEGCPDKNKGIYDGIYINLLLTTKDEIKALKFYAPDFYENLCPEIKDRAKLLAIDNLFKDIFK